MKYRASRYNFEVQEEDGALLLYNSSSGGFLVVDDPTIRKETMQVLSEGIDGEIPERLKLLEEGKFLVPSEIDERDEVFHKFIDAVNNEKQFELGLLPVEDCNFRCRYCYEHFRKLRMTPAVEEKIEKLFYHKTKNAEKVRIAWYGGEPLLGMDSIVRLSEAFRDIIKERGLMSNVHITTNGFLLTSENAQKLISLGIDKFHITLDGPPETHDRLRILENGKGTFDTIVNNLLELKETKYPFQVLVRCNFDRNTQINLLPFLGWFNENFGDDERFSVYFTGIYPSGTERDREFDFCSKNEIAIANIRLRKSALNDGVANLYQKMPTPVSTYCSAVVRNSRIVGADGILWKCTDAIEPEDAVGELDENGEEKYNAKYYEWINFGYRDDKVCWNCAILPLCQAGCVLVRKSRKRSCLYSPRNIKRLMRLCYQEYLRKI
jgi:uncharacterized protein